MGWFGSLDLAYKYAIVLSSLLFIVIVAASIKLWVNRRRLHKHIKQAELESSTANADERVELNKRDLDEGDLFGIRAIQSGYFGGVAQSRPASIAEDQSQDGTLLGSEKSPKQSPKLRSSSPMSSTLTLPLEARPSASPLRKTTMANDSDEETHTRGTAPYPARSTLHPADARGTGDLSYDPSVNMHLNVPPSPSRSRPSTSASETGDRSPGNSLDLSLHSNAVIHSYPSPDQHDAHHPPAHPPTMPVHDNRSSVVRSVEPIERQHAAIHSQSASIVSKSSDTSRREDHRFSIQDDEGFSSAPVKSRPVSSRSVYPPRGSSYGTPARSTENLMQHQQEPIPPPPRIASTTVSDWGPSIFHEIDQTLSGTRDNRHNHHVSHLSDASSVCSFLPSAHRQSAKRFSTAAPKNSRTSNLADNGPQSQRASIVEGTRRVSDASSHQPPPSEQSGGEGNSHRNTRELSDLYDSYRRHSKQGQSFVPSGAPAQRSGGTASADGYFDRQNVYAPSRVPDGNGTRRGNHLDVTTVPTIAEVPSPLPSPLPRAAIGKAM